VKVSGRRRNLFVVSGMVVAGHGVMVPVESPTSASEESMSGSSDEIDEGEAPPIVSEQPPD